MAGMEIMSCIERRRRWSDEAKLRILAEGDEPGARIGDVARQHDIHPARSAYGGNPSAMPISASTSTIGADSDLGSSCRNNLTVIACERDTRYFAPWPGDHFDFVRMLTHSQNLANGE